MVTSTSTPGSMLMEVCKEYFVRYKNLKRKQWSLTICFTTSEGLCKSIRRLWILISKRSQVLVPIFAKKPRVRKRPDTTRRKLTLSARRLSGCDTQNLGGQTHGALHLQVLLLGTSDQISAHLLQIFHITRSERDSDPVEVLFFRWFAACLRLERCWGGHSAKHSEERGISIKKQK